ncbi:MAG: hypothetical protein H8F28_26645 [Fibrella sp.]|nr:hypothetical protein [Armatimonadota bacterium]
MRSVHSLAGLAIITVASLSFPVSVHAQFLYNGGVGEIEHAVYGLNAVGPAAPVFAFDDGQLLAPGGFYPSLNGAPITEVDTGLQPLPLNPGFLFLNTPGGIMPGFGQGTTQIRAVNTNRAIGVAVSNLSLVDASPAGFASTNTFGGDGLWQNISGQNINFVGGNFMALSANLNKPLGSFVAVGVRSVFELYNGGGFLVNTFTPLPIVFAFDGFNPLSRADFIQAGLFQVQATGPNSVRFAATSLLNFAVPAGHSLRIRGAATLIADPGADMELEAMPSNFTLPDAGSGASTDAEEAFATGTGTGPVIVPEAGTLPLLVTGGAALLLATVVIHRRATSQ